MLLEHSAILFTFSKLPFSIKTIIFSIFKWSLKTGFTVVTITPDMEPSLDYTIDLSSKYMSFENHKQSVRFNHHCYSSTRYLMYVRCTNTCYMNVRVMLISSAQRLYVFLFD